LWNLPPANPEAAAAGINLHFCPVEATMFSFLMLLPVLAAQSPVLYYMFPITAAVSLVYSASRYEEPQAIIRKSIRLFLQITVFLVGILLLLYVLTVKL